MITVTMSGTIPRGISSATVTKTVRGVFTKLKKAGKGSVGVRFVSETEIAKLNRAYRKKNRSTDVLSFASASPNVSAKEPKDYGDIVIASAYAKREASRRSIPFAEEIARLVAHGTLHLLGYDHATEKDEAHMFRLQEAVVDRVASRL